VAQLVAVVVLELVLVMGPATMVGQAQSSQHASQLLVVAVVVVGQGLKDFHASQVVRASYPAFRHFCLSESHALWAYWVLKAAAALACQESRAVPWAYQALSACPALQPAALVCQALKAASWVCPAESVY